MYLCTWMHTTGCMWRSEGNLGCGSLPSTLLISLPCSCGCKVHCSVNFWGFSWFYLHLLAELSDYRCSHYVGYRSLNSGLHACLLSHLPSPIFYLNFKLYLLVKLCLAFKSCCNYILWITQLKKPQNCLYDGSVVEGTGHQARWPEFDLWGPYGQRREPTPISFSLASTYSPLHIHIQYAYIYIIINVKDHKITYTVIEKTFEVWLSWEAHTHVSCLTFSYVTLTSCPSD